MVLDPLLEMRIYFQIYTWINASIVVVILTDNCVYTQVVILTETRMYNQVVILTYTHV